MKYILYNAKDEEINNLKNVKDKLVLTTEDFDICRNYQKYHKIKTRDWLQKWSYSKINGKTIREIFSYNDQTSFYLMSYFFLRENFLFKSRVGLNLTFTLIDIFEDFVDDDISVISYDPHNDYFVRLLKKVCDKKGVKLEVLKNKNIKLGKFEFLRSHSFTIYSMVKTRIYIRYLIGVLRKILRIPYKRKNGVFFLSNVRFSRNNEENNIMFGTLVRKLNESNIKNQTITYALPNKIEYLMYYIKNLMFNKTKYIGDYYSIRLLYSNRKLFKYYRKRWKKIRNDNSFKNTFIYKGINVYDLTKPLFDLIFNSTAYIIADNLNATEQILKKENPKVFVIDHEDNFYGKGLLMNAKKTNIKSIALEHEVIEPTDVNHSHIKDKKALDKNSVFWRPLPTKKCASSEYAKKVLLDVCNYPKDKIAITGNPKFDDLIIKKYDKKSILKKYNLSEGIKKVLYASEGMKDESELLFKSISKIKDVIFLVKPHPQEDFEFYRDLKKRYPNKNIILFPKDTNIYELMSISDILITKTSTVGLEAMIKSLPLIVFNPNKQIDVWEYIKSGGSLEAKNSDELTKHINSLLFDKKIRKAVLDKSKKFVKYRAYKQDGRASERVINEIKTLI